MVGPPGHPLRHLLPPSQLAIAGAGLARYAASCHLATVAGAVTDRLHRGHFRGSMDLSLAASWSQVQRGVRGHSVGRARDAARGDSSCTSLKVQGAVRPLPAFPSPANVSPALGGSLLRAGGSRGQGGGSSAAHLPGGLPQAPAPPPRPRHGSGLCGSSAFLGSTPEPQLRGQAEFRGPRAGGRHSRPHAERGPGPQEGAIQRPERWSVSEPPQRGQGREQRGADRQECGPTCRPPTWCTVLPDCGLGT